MTFITGLLAGLLIGWLVEWLIDWLYWRRQPLAAALAGDPLEIVSGIGGGIKAKLYDAGITTFEALSKLSPQDLEEIVGPQIRNLADEEALIAEAKHFAKEIKMARR